MVAEVAIGVQVGIMGSGENSLKRYSAIQFLGVLRLYRAPSSRGVAQDDKG